MTKEDVPTRVSIQKTNELLQLIIEMMIDKTVSDLDRRVYRQELKEINDENAVEDEDEDEDEDDDRCEICGDSNCEDNPEKEEKIGTIADELMALQYQKQLRLSIPLRNPTNIGIISFFSALQMRGISNREFNLYLNKKDFHIFIASLHSVHIRTKIDSNQSIILHSNGSIIRVKESEFNQPPYLEMKDLRERVNILMALSSMV